jgi:hypothetical protein
MPVYFYYGRDSENKPIKTVCLAVSRFHITRGTAICSDKDQPCKKIGRAIAAGRALKCLEKRKSDWDKSAGFYKSIFKPTLTVFEKSLLAKNTKQIAHYKNST